jgi:hypothetical protein
VGDYATFGDPSTTVASVGQRPRLVRRRIAWLVGAVSAATLTVGAGALAADTDPPFNGTIFIDPDIITSADPSTFAGMRYKGRGQRTVFDRRKGDFVTMRAYLFAARFTDGVRMEVVMNPEFRRLPFMTTVARKYSRIVGRLPKALRDDVDALWIHRGVQPFGGGNNSLLIHTGKSVEYERDSILEETLVHEATHTSLDPTHADAPGWRAAQAADPSFISTYARDNSDREDVAESFLPYLAVRYRPDRIDLAIAAQIEGAIPKRLAYFDQQGFELGPLARKSARPLRRGTCAELA